MSRNKDSEIVKALADIASQGEYKVSPAGARVMNSVFAEVADLINRLEAQEKEIDEFFETELGKSAEKAVQEALNDNNE